MTYLQYFLNLWPSPDKPVALWNPERGVLWRNEWVECYDHLEGLKVLAEKFHGVKIWDDYLGKIKNYANATK